MILLVHFIHIFSYAPEEVIDFICEYLDISIVTKKLTMPCTSVECLVQYKDFLFVATIYGGYSVPVLQLYVYNNVTWPL
jgi:hypothetical protein